MKKTVILVVLYVAMVTSDLSPYKPRGWRPNGQHFNPNNNRLHAYYGPPGLRTYEPPDTTTHHPPLFTTTTVSPTVTTTTIKTTTTPRSREPTTPNVPEEDFESNPALAIANSFAFNRPVYVYNSFPFLPGPLLLN